MDKQVQDERWKALTEDGRQARIASYKELLKLQKEEANSYLITIEDLEKLYGKHNLNPRPVKKEGWIVIYSCGDPIAGRVIYNTKEEAKKDAVGPNNPQIVKIEWDE